MALVFNESFPAILLQFCFKFVTYRILGRTAERRLAQSSTLGVQAAVGVSNEAFSRSRGWAPLSRRLEAGGVGEE